MQELLSEVLAAAEPHRAIGRVADYIPALAKVDKLAEAGHKGAKELATYYVGQAVGLMQHELRARDVVYEFKKDFAEAVERLNGMVG